LEGETKLKKIPKQKYTPEFRELSVKRVKAGQSVGAVARELGLIEQTLRKKPCRPVTSTTWTPPEIR
jgi:transposase